MVKLKEFLISGKIVTEKKKGVLDDDEVLIPGIGRMLYKQLKKNIELKSKDLHDRVRKGEYDRISDSMLEVFSHMVRVSRSYQTGDKVPSSTLFKEFVDNEK